MPVSIRASHAALVENLQALGFVRVIADGVALRLDELPGGLDLGATREVLVVVDRLTVGAASDERLAEAIGSRQYLDATRDVLQAHGGLWFLDESYVVSRKRG